jgi:hypothetical protein
LAEQKVPKEKTEEDREDKCGENEMEKGGDILDGERPQDYMFIGFVVFALFGPYVPEGLESNRLLHLFNQSDDVEGTNNPNSRKRGLGQQSARQEDSVSEATNRNNQFATGSNESVSGSTQIGMGWHNDVQVTQIALQSKFADAREKDQRINCLHFQINRAQQLVKTHNELGNGPRRHALWSPWKALGYVQQKPLRSPWKALGSVLP